LATLEHPGIPRLIDSGIAPSGEAFLAMEFVEGEPITSYVKRKASGLRERLKLFLQACEAVRYAHAHLVVHRDIKPQNVLVGDGDRVPVVKVVDFGIAKPLAPSEDRITRTGPSAPMTLAYAAPEQLRGESADPATDVFALGLLLYTLLADRLPYDLAGKSRRDAEALVLDSDIPRPSTMVTAPWARRVRGDLDHVVLKALAKEPARRYPTADALYADVERFLEGVPVAARRPSRLYAAWRLAWRRRAVVVGTAVAIAAAGATYAVGLSRQRAAALRAAEEDGLADVGHGPSSTCWAPGSTSAPRRAAVDPGCRDGG
jgi:serine/threonine protein kinase